jgi:NAD(P)-dependent dehydrogenase (short-subunit alcohol dehydrogenase family)
MTEVLLITGGSRGIGAATARLGAKNGYAVAINYRAAKDQAQALVAEIERDGGQAIAVRGDVASQEQVEAMFREVDAFGPLGALVNSAGITVEAQTKVADLEQASLERMLAVNVIGTLLCCREAVRRMSTRFGGKGGAIVNVSSMAAAIGGRPGRTAYAASKGAVDSFTIGFAREVAREGIRVNALRPGMTMTDMTDAVRRDPELYARTAETIAMNRCAEPEEMARPILWLLSDEASFISGALLDGSGGGFMLGQVAPP